jgi:Zn-dependent protease
MEVVPPPLDLVPTLPGDSRADGPAAAQQSTAYENDQDVRYEPDQEPADDQRPLTYSYRVPLILFLLSCVSIFVTGCCRWMPSAVFVECWNGGLSFDFTPLRRAILSEWQTGLTFMVSLLAILLAHEFGHFVMTVIYRVRATLPLVIPFPISPFGTLGAVIAMEPGKANRRQIFDIGIAGPLAGLVIAIPVLIAGIMQIDLSQPAAGQLAIKPPLMMDWLLQWLQPTAWADAHGEIWMSQTNALLFSGWMGLFFTGLNMFPVGQLDGGHITYTLMGRGAHLLARGLMIIAFAYMAYTGNTLLLLMALLIMLMGTDHPPTADDSVPLGWPRVLLGWASLILPIVCLTPDAIVMT